MKTSIKRLFLIGVGVAAVGLTIANRKKIQAAIDGFVKKGHLTVKEGELLAKELHVEAEKAVKKLDTHMKKVKAQAKRELKKA